MTEFEQLVRQMRALQKEYFRTRNGVVLGECKKIERMVDDYLKIDDAVKKEDDHPKLF